jgi:rhodanese-related sulfurtransferase
MRAVREGLILLLVAAAPAALAIALHPQLADRDRAGLEAGAVRLHEVRQWAGSGEILWIDGRSAAEYADDHIPGALPLEEAKFSEQLGAIVAAWRPGQRIVVYCSSASCGTSRALAQRLHDAGFGNDVHHLHGGWEAWQEARR